MLTIINLHTISKIFSEDVSGALSPMAKMIYINCLMHHFKDKPATVSSIHAFEIFEEDMDYQKFRKYFQELHKAGLVSIGQNSIVFHNVWGRHIDHSRLGKVSAEAYVGGFNIKPAAEYKQELLESENMVELAAMKHRIGKSQVQKMIEVFIKEQSTLEKKYTSFSDCISHFNHWLSKNLEKVPKDVVRSSNKLLG